MKKVFLVSLIFFSCLASHAQKNNIDVIAYYTGGPDDAEKFAVGNLTHIIFSFCHLKGNKLHVNNAKDTTSIQQLVNLKTKFPGLKVMLSLGGWGGCKSCSEVFSTKKGRKEFAQSVKEVNCFFGTDGIDLDWEYPAISGFPEHQFLPEDKTNFTSLVTILRKKLGRNNELSFAAGGFKKFIDESIEWKKVMKKVDRVNLMTYDLVSGYSTVTGHHTPLYSTPHNPESVDHGVNMLIEKGVPQQKIVIGAAFYGRMWEAVDASPSSLYQPGKFRAMISNKLFDTRLSADSGFIKQWDENAMAPYLYNPDKKLFVTYDDEQSVKLKTRYAIDNKLGGIMFWQLRDDKYDNGLLNAINEEKIKN